MLANLVLHSPLVVRMLVGFDIRVNRADIVLRVAPLSYQRPRSLTG